VLQCLVILNVRGFSVINSLFGLWLTQPPYNTEGFPLYDSMELLSHAAWCDDDLGDELVIVSADQHWTFLLNVASFLRIDFATLVAGEDNGRRGALPWCVNENRVFCGNTLRLNNDLVRARDKAFVKLRRVGLVLEIDDILDEIKTQSIFVHLTATFLAYDLEIQDVKKELESLFTQNPTLRRRADVPHVPFWRINQLISVDPPERNVVARQSTRPRVGLLQ